MDIAKDIKDRITAAASALYEEVQRADFPTVAAVRSRAGVDMNAASIVMREWRRAQTAQAAPLAVDVPERVRASSSVALGALWAEAQSLANESLLSAQAGWEAERAEAETLRAELSAAFDAKAEELQAAQTEITRHETAATASEKRLRELAEQLSSVQERAGTAEARALEIERRANDLSTELERVHDQAKTEREKHTGEVMQVQAELTRVRADFDQVRGDLAGVKAKADAQAAHNLELRKQTDSEALRLAERVNKVEAERDAARQANSEAREEAARLRGMVEAMEGVQANLTRLVEAGQTVKSTKGSKSP